MADANLSLIFYVYKLTCSVTGKSYVGHTKRKLVERMGEHRNSSCSKKLRAAIETHGFETFSYETICECKTRAEAREKEKVYIRELSTGWPSGYNVQGSGKGAIARVSTPEMKERRAAAQRRLWDDPNHRKIVSERVKAFAARPENKKIASERALARWRDPAYRAKQEASHWVRTNSKETSEKIKQIALEREAKARADGTAHKRPWLVEGNKRAWADKDRRERRLVSIRKFWNSKEGKEEKARLSALMSEENAKRVSDPEYMAKFRASMAKTKGRKCTLEARKKMSAAKRGKKKGPLPEAVRQKISILAKQRAKNRQALHRCSDA